MAYVGQSKNVFLRFEQHKADLKQNMHFNNNLQADYNKHQNMEEYMFIALYFNPLINLNSQNITYVELFFIVNFPKDSHRFLILKVIQVILYTIRIK